MYGAYSTTEYAHIDWSLALGHGRDHPIVGHDGLKEIGRVWNGITPSNSLNMPVLLIFGHPSHCRLPLQPDLAGPGTGPGPRPGIPAPPFFDGAPRTPRPCGGPSVYLYVLPTNRAIKQTGYFNAVVKETLLWSSLQGNSVKGENPLPL